VSVSCKML